MFTSQDKHALIHNHHRISKPGYNVLEARQAYKHPDDKHLLFVLASRLSDGEYVTWLYNTEDKGFSYGNYYTDFAAAYKNFQERD